MVRFSMFLACVLPAVAVAGTCDQQINAASNAQGDALVSAWSKVVACNADEAIAALPKILPKAKDVETTAKVALVAIDAKQYKVSWGMLEQIPDYTAREQIARAVGATCAEHTEVGPFLQGAYYGVNDRQFGQWAEAIRTCESKDLTAWLDKTVAEPPPRTYDEKYNKLIGAHAKRDGAAALPSFVKAGIAASANGGPFTSILDQMNEAIRPAEYGAKPSEADKAALTKALVEVGTKAKPEQAALVADRLFQAGAESEAAALLPAIYPDRVQGGKVTWGVAAVEACDEQAVVHFAPVEDPGKRWNVTNDVSQPVSAFKPRLKCDSGDWVIVTTSEPIGKKNELEDWAEKLSEDWSTKGFDAKLREEKSVTLN